MTQQTFGDIIEEEIEEAIEIAESELGHDIQEAYLNASPAKQKNANVILMAIRAIYDSTDEENDKELDIFANVLKLETVLGLC
jgi:CRISPR/Cas system CSM-associated protein Csm2 small subunit